MKVPRYSVIQIMVILKLAETGTPVPSLWRERVVTAARYLDEERLKAAISLEDRERGIR
jgi:hypothetical protein